MRLNIIEFFRETHHMNCCHAIGPYFCESRLSGQVYANLLQNVLRQLMKDVPLHVRMNMWMQHDVHHSIMLCVQDK